MLSPLQAKVFLRHTLQQLGDRLFWQFPMYLYLISPHPGVWLTNFLLHYCGISANLKMSLMSLVRLIFLCNTPALN